MHKQHILHVHATEQKHTIYASTFITALKYTIHPINVVLPYFLNVPFTFLGIVWNAQCEICFKEQLS